MSSLKKESPLEFLNLEEKINNSDLKKSKILASQIKFCGFLNLRGVFNDISQEINSILNLKLPQKVNKFVENDEFRVFCLSPDEWLVVTKEDCEDKVKEKIDEALSKKFYALTNVTGGNIILRLKGENMRELLNKGSDIDFHQDYFQIGDLAQTQIAHSVAFVARTGDDVFDIVVRRSFAEYLWLFFEKNAAEYGFAVVDKIDI